MHRSKKPHSIIASTRRSRHRWLVEADPLSGSSLLSHAAIAAKVLAHFLNPLQHAYSRLGSWAAVRSDARRFKQCLSKADPQTMRLTGLLSTKKGLLIGLQARVAIPLSGTRLSSMILLSKQPDLRPNKT
jgi:hypothetical protein